MAQPMSPSEKAAARRKELALQKKDPKAYEKLQKMREREANKKRAKQGIKAQEQRSDRKSVV